jgi:DNA-binding MarR family transcriptional regulator
LNIYEQLIIALRQVHENFIDVMQSNEEKLSHGHLFLLFMIYRMGSIKTTDISTHFGITPGAATGIADKIENLGLIQRERDKNDRRVVFISLSPKGMEFVQNKKNEHITLFEEILSDFSNEEMISTIRMLHKISNAIVQYKISKPNDCTRGR